MTKTYAKDGSHLVLCAFNHAVSKMCRILQFRTVDASNGDEGQSLRCVHQLITMLFILTEKQSVWRMDTSEVSVQRIAFTSPYWRDILFVPYVFNEVFRELIE